MGSDRNHTYNSWKVHPFFWRLLLGLLLIFVLCFPVNSQTFTLNGTAALLGGNTYQITPDTTNAVGALWSINQINLTQPFDFSFMAYFGNKDSGGHGMAFVLQRAGQQVLGQNGNGMGYRNISPSAAFAFDTYMDLLLGDPFFDHVCLHTNGNVSHALAPYYSATSSGSNIEDGQWHSIRVTWTPATTNFRLYFDNMLTPRINATIDLINSIFGGNSMVWWGITASTGAVSNVHEVQFPQPFPLTFPTPLKICTGDTVQVVVPPGTNHSWIPASGVSDPSSRTPMLYPTGNATYTVNYTSPSGVASQVSIQVLVNILPTAYQLFVPGGDSTYCKGGPGVDISLDGSQTTVEYDLLLNGLVYWPDVIGNGSGISFGYQQPSGLYTCIGTDTITGCSIDMLGSVTVIIDSLPIAYNVTGAGAFCLGGAGQQLGLDGSEPGIQYTMFRNGLTIITTIPGNGLAINFGYQQVAGSYTVRAVNPLTGCTRWMNGTAVVTILPLPIVTLSAFPPGCAGSPPIALSGGSPLGGTYSGIGVINDTLFGTMAPGSISLTYTYTSPTNGCSNTASSTMTLFPLPKPQLGPDTYFCAGDSIQLQASQAYAAYSWSQGATSQSITVKTPGTYRLTVTDPNGCQGSDTILVWLESLPIITFTPPGPFCIDALPQALTGGNPAGGTYSGFAVSAGIFNPGMAGPGNHTIHYTYTDPATQCKNSAPAQITVYPLPLMAHALLPALCVSSTPLILVGGQPTGGIYSGPGVSGGVFNPAIGDGVYNLTYSYTDPNTLCSNSIVTQITVNALPGISIPAFPVVCEDALAVPLPLALPPGGTYSGTGVSGGSFTPVLGAGPYLIRYHYADPITHCEDSAEAILEVRPLPSLALILPPPLCEDTTPVFLSGGQPAGGLYAGTYVNGNYFTPFAPGNYVITYTYQDTSTTCLASISDTIRVNPLPLVNLTAFGAVCTSDPPFQLNGGTPPGGVYSGNGVSGGLFDPGTGPNTYSIQYYYQDTLSGCYDTASASLVVHPLPQLSHAPIQSQCMDALPYTLPGGLPAGGWYTGEGISAYSFHPVSAGSFDLHYHYQDTITLCEDSILISIIVHDLPVVTFVAPAPLCASEPAFSLSGGLPAGGSYGGNGVSGGVFNPGIGAGSYEIWYAYTDPLTTCRDTVFDTLIVMPLPVVSLVAPGPFCLSSADTVLYTGNPAGGGYGGNGMIDDTFSPMMAGVGSHQIFYTYADSMTGCQDTVFGNIIVYPLPQMFMPSLPSLCANDAPVSLTGAAPLGGTWQGTGVSGNSFSPGLSGPGDFLLTYSFTDPLTSCADSVSDTIHVHPLPLVSLSLDTSLCDLAQTLALGGGSPAGGTYGGSGVTGSSFSPSGPGDYVIYYVAEDLLTACRDTAYDTLTVFPLPVVSFTAPGDYCVGDAPVALNTGLPVGGTYSGTGVVADMFDPAIGAGQYSLTYTYINTLTGCSNAASDTITVYALPIVSFPSLGPFCANDTLSLLPQGSPPGGVWGGLGIQGIYFDPGIGAGIHLIWYTWDDSLTGCSDTAFRQVVVNEVPDVDFVAPGPYCYGDPPVSLTGGNPFGGSYSGTGVNGNLFDPGYGSGTYWVTYTYQSPQTGCLAKDSAEIVVFPIPQVSAGVDISLCTDTLPFLLPAGVPAGGAWEGLYVAAGLFNPPMPGTYSLIYLYDDTATACGASDTMEITVLPIPDPVLPATISICEGEEYLLQVQPGGYAAYEWSDGSMAPYLLITQPGLYWVQVTDLNLCKSIPDTIMAEVFPLPDPGLPSQMSGCRNAPVVLQAVSNMVSYLWQDGSTGTDYLVYAPGVYWVEVEDMKGCKNRDSVMVTFLPTPEVQLPALMFLCDRPFIRLDASQREPGCTYYWSDGDTHAVREMHSPGVYYVTVTNGLCQGWGVTEIRSCAEIWAPNAFTPNGDGINEYFMVVSSEPLLSGRMVIMDRWGKVVFESNDPLAKWDGSCRGSPCGQDIYTWIFDFVRDGLVPIEREGRRVGHVLLMR